MLRKLREPSRSNTKIYRKCSRSKRWVTLVDRSFKLRWLTLWCPLRLSLRTLSTRLTTVELLEATKSRMLSRLPNSFSRVVLLCRVKNISTWSVYAADIWLITCDRWHSSIFLLSRRKLSPVSSCRRTKLERWKSSRRLKLWRKLNIPLHKLREYREIVSSRGRND